MSKAASDTHYSVWLEVRKDEYSHPSVSAGDWFQDLQRTANPRVLKSLINGVVQLALHLICSWLDPGMRNPQLGRADCIPLSPTPAFIQPPNSLLMSSQVNPVRGFWYLEKISWLLAITFFWIPFNREWTLCRWKFSWRETITAQLAPWTQDNVKQGTPATMEVLITETSSKVHESETCFLMWMSFYCMWL